MSKPSNAPVRRISLVQLVRVQSPCPLAEGEWRLDEHERFCSVCNLHVHNLSSRTRDQAESLLASATGRLCLRYEQDLRRRPITADRRGAILLARAISGLGALLRPLRRVAAALGLAAVVANLSGCFLFRTSGVVSDERLAKYQSVHAHDAPLQPARDPQQER